MNQSFLSPRLMVGAAIVGLVGAAGVFIYEQVYAEKRRAMLVSEVARLDKQLSSMQSELAALRELQKETVARRPPRKLRAKREVVPPAAGDVTDSEYYTDCQSLVGDLDMDSEEFYDVPSDEEDDTLRESVRARNSVIKQNEDLNTTLDETETMAGST